MRNALSMALGSLLAAASAAACVGSIGDDPGAAQGSGPNAGADAGGGSTASALCGDIGTVSIHRLNSTEYDNTVRDLLGDTTRPAAAAFPADDTSYGFDNNGDVLSISPLLLEAYDTAAQTLAANALSGPSRATIMICDPQTGADPCARKILGGFAKKAWRRPVTDQELGELAAMIGVATAQGDGFEVGIQLALRAILASPNFVYRAEVDPDPASVTPHPLGDYELASRLSYFLWSTMPDDALFAAADGAKLTGDPAELGRQADRMLADPRAQTLVDDFAMQWMTAGLDEVKPSTATYPTFDPDLRAAMVGETREFMRSFLFGDVSFLDMIDANYTYANARLATHYGLPGVTGTDIVRVPLDPGTHRGGILTHASVLTLSSVVNRTSPTRRGRWVLTNLLCSPPPPPPANVPSLPPQTDATTLRQLLEQHRKDPACSGCHSLMDPIGLGMENYDGIGAWRTTDKGHPIDATGALTGAGSPGGEPFDGTMQLEPLIKADPRFATCATSKLFAYAVGRAPAGDADTCRMKALTDAFKGKSYRMKDLVKMVVTDDAFRARHGGK
jgi:Protein of unknown function (DUF1592)/Protein of unknown function (DUF1588)/Protein of unknown function (DUF1587)/Protein of unknown function (DUF1595)/Protein of unknown function (DUF1585)